MESGSELSQFKDNIVLYEFLMDRAQKRSVDIIMPKVKEVQEKLSAEMEEGKQRMKYLEAGITEFNARVAEFNEKQLHQSSGAAGGLFSDPLFIAGMIFLLSSIGYFAYRISKQARLFI